MKVQRPKQPSEQICIEPIREALVQSFETAVRPAAPLDAPNGPQQSCGTSPAPPRCAHIAYLQEEQRLALLARLWGCRHAESLTRSTKSGGGGQSWKPSSVIREARSADGLASRQPCTGAGTEFGDCRLTASGLRGPPITVIVELLPSSSVVAPPAVMSCPAPTLLLSTTDSS